MQNCTKLNSETLNYVARNDYDLKFFEWNLDLHICTHLNETAQSQFFREIASQKDYGVWQTCNFEWRRPLRRFMGDIRDV